MRSERELNPWTSILHVLWDPQPVIELASKRRPILPVYVTLTLFLSMATWYTTSQTVDIQINASLAMMQSQPSNTSFDPTFILRLATWGGAAIKVLFWPISVGLIGALAFLVLAPRNGERLPFGSYLALYGYALVPGFLGKVLETLAQSQASSMAQMHAVTMSAAALFSSAQPGTFAHAVLLALNPFSIWTSLLALMAFQWVHRMNGRRTLALGTILTTLLLYSAWMQSRVWEQMSLL